MPLPQPDPHSEIRQEFTVTGMNFSVKLVLRNNYVIEAPLQLRYLNGWRGTKAIRYLKQRKFEVKEITHEGDGF